MKDYKFILKYRLGEVCEDPEQYLGALAESGCEDAVVDIGQNGRISLSFTRESESALAAISSALEDVQRAIPDAKLVEAPPDFVGVTDIADLFGVSRQYIRQLIQSREALFPEPIHEGKPSLWHLTDVLAWFQENQAKAVEPEVYEVSQVNMQVNVFKSCVRATTVLQGRLYTWQNQHKVSYIMVEGEESLLVTVSGFPLCLNSAWLFAVACHRRFFRYHRIQALVPSS